MLEVAEENGVREGFERIVLELERRGFRGYPRQYGLNLNLGGRLQCLWLTTRKGAIHMAYLPANFPEIFGVGEKEAEERLGGNSIDLPPDDAFKRIVEWADVIAEYQARESGGGEADTAMGGSQEA